MNYESITQSRVTSNLSEASNALVGEWFSEFRVLNFYSKLLATTSKMALLVTRNEF